MLKIAAIGLSAGLLMLHLQSNALASDKNERFLQRRAAEIFCSTTDSDADRAYCQALRILNNPRCAGTVEERLTCLETQLLDQQLVIDRLRSQLRRMAEPRIHPLDGLSLNEPDRTAR